MNEIWMPCLDHDYIEVSNFSRVRTVNRFTTYVKNGKEVKAQFKSKILSPCVANNGYLEISYKKGVKRIKQRVHRLVAIAFINGYSKELTVNHINGNKLDNSLKNLEWVSLSKNSSLEWETGLVNLMGDNHPSSKLSSGKVRIIRELLLLGVNPNKLSVLLDVCPNTIYLIRDNKRWNELY